MEEIGLMLADTVREQLWKIAAPYYPRNDQAHGRSHIERVLKSAKEIGKREGADLEIIEVATIGSLGGETSSRDARFRPPIH